MGKTFLMALDLGGGSGRCLLVDPDSGATYITRRRWSHPVTPDTAGLGFDLDLEDMWSRLAGATAWRGGRTSSPRRISGETPWR